jgi:hypothetical protein
MIRALSMLALDRLFTLVRGGTKVATSMKYLITYLLDSWVVLGSNSYISLPSTLHCHVDIVDMKGLG